MSTATKGMGSNFGSLLAIAYKAWERSQSNQLDAIVAVVFSAFAVESFLNYMVRVARSEVMNSASPQIVAFSNILDDMEEQQARLSAKIQMAHYILAGTALDRGSLPYQDFSLLIDLRNATTHNRPEIFDWPPSQFNEPHRLIKRLVDGKVLPSQPPGRVPQLLVVLCCPEVARWAHNVALQMMNFLTSILPPGNLQESFKFSLASFPSIP